MCQKPIRRLPFRGLFAIVALSAVCGPGFARAEPAGANREARNDRPEPTYLTVTWHDEACVVQCAEADKALYRSRDPRAGIEWALKHSRVAIVAGGRFRVSEAVRIPRPNVALIVAEDATLEVARGAKLAAVSEGHGKYRPLIHNQGRDNVAIINLGTLRASPQGGTCIMFNGRSGGELGISGGLIFSSGTLAQCGDAVWLVDSKDLQVPFAGAVSYDNNLMAIEGCEDVEIDTVAGLAGDRAGENETIDLNSYSRRIRIRQMIGTSRSEQVLDVNNSTDVMVDEIVGYTGGEAFRDELLSIIHYGPHGRRLTQRPRIPKSKNVEIRSQRVAEPRIRQWKIVTEVDGLPESLPRLQITVRVIGNPEADPVTVVERSYQIELDGTPTATVIE